MTAISLLLIVVLAAAGIALVVSCYHDPGGRLRHVVAEIARPSSQRRPPWWRRAGRGQPWPSALFRRIDLGELGILGVEPERLVAQSLIVMAIAAAGAVSSATMAMITGSLPAWPPVVIAIGAGVLVTVIRFVTLMARARAVHTDVRYQLAGYLDIVTIIVSSNIGHEGALRIAAESGSGQLFRALRHRIRESTTAGRSGVDALQAVASDLRLDELSQVATTIDLAVAEGSPVVRTLSATCATLRNTLAAEHETDARLRTSRLTAPLIGMALIFMGLVVYPALNP